MHNMRHEVRMHSTLIFIDHSLLEVPGKGMGFLKNFQNFRVRVRKSCRTSTSSGYCDTGVQKHKGVPGGYKTCCTRASVIGATGVHNSQKFHPGYGYECRTELPEVPGTGTNVLHNVHNFFEG